MKSSVKLFVVLAILSNVLCLDLGERFSYRKDWRSWTEKSTRRHRIQVIRWLQPVCVIPGPGVPFCPKPLAEHQDEYERNNTQAMEAGQPEKSNTNAEQWKNIDNKMEPTNSKSRAVSSPKLLSPRLVYSTDVEGVDRIEIGTSKASSQPDVGHTVILNLQSSTARTGESGVHRNKKYLLITGAGETVPAAQPKPAIYVTKVLRSPVTATLVAKHCFPEMDVPLCEEHEGTLTIHQKSAGLIEQSEERRKEIPHTIADDSLHGSSTAEPLLSEKKQGGAEPSGQIHSSEEGNVNNTETLDLQNNPTDDESRKTPPLSGQAVRDFLGNIGVINNAAPLAKDAIDHFPEIVATPTKSLNPEEFSIVAEAQNIEIDVKLSSDGKLESIENVSPMSEGGLLHRFLNIHKPTIASSFWDFRFNIFSGKTPATTERTVAENEKSTENKVEVSVEATTIPTNLQSSDTEATTIGEPTTSDEISVKPSINSTTPSAAGETTAAENVTLANGKSIFPHPKNDSLITEEPGGNSPGVKTTASIQEQSAVTSGPLNISTPANDMPLSNVSHKIITEPVSVDQEVQTTAEAPSTVPVTTVVPSDPATIEASNRQGKNLNKLADLHEPNNKTEDPPPAKLNTTAPVEESTASATITEPIPTSTVDKIPETVSTPGTTSESTITVENIITEPTTATSLQTTTSAVHIDPNVTKKEAASPTEASTSSANVSSSPGVAMWNVTNKPEVEDKLKATQLPAEAKSTVSKLPDSASTTTDIPPDKTTENQPYVSDSTTEGGRTSNTTSSEPPDRPGEFSTDTTTPSASDEPTGATENLNVSTPAGNESSSNAGHEITKDPVDVHQEPTSTAQSPSTVSSTTVAPTEPTSLRDVTKNTTEDVPQDGNMTTAAVKQPAASTTTDQTNGATTTHASITETKQISTSGVDKIPVTVPTQETTLGSTIPIENITSELETAASIETTTPAVHITPNAIEKKSLSSTEASASSADTSNPPVVAISNVTTSPEVHVTPNVTKEESFTSTEASASSVDISSSPDVAISNITKKPHIKNEINATQVNAQQDPPTTPGTSSTTVSDTNAASSDPAASHDVTKNTTGEVPRDAKNTTAPVDVPAESTTIDQSHNAITTTDLPIIVQTEETRTSIIDKIPETVPTLETTSTTTISMVNITNKPEIAASIVTTTPVV